MKLIGRVLVYIHGLIIEWGLVEDETVGCMPLIKRNFIRLDGESKYVGTMNQVFYGAGVPENLASLYAKGIHDGEIKAEIVDLEGNPLDVEIDWALLSKLWHMNYAQKRVGKKNQKEDNGSNGSGQSPF